MNLFVLQFEWHLPKSHEFYVEYLFWYNRPAGDTVRSYEGLWTLVHDWVRRKQDSKNRKQALTDHLPGAFIQEKTPKGKGKGTGKDKDGNPQICFAWRNNGVCPNKDAGTCVYTHPNNQKGKGKPDGKNGKKGGNRSNSNSSRNGKGGPGGGKGSGTPRGGKTVTDVKLLCKNYLKGKCDKTDCKYHHNGPCAFHAKGKCNKGDDCVFSHHVTPALVSVVAPKATAKSKAKKDGDADA